MPCFSLSSISARKKRAFPLLPVAAGFAALLNSIAAYGQIGLSLHDAILQAQNSPSARMTQAQIDEAHGQVTQAGLRPNPRLYLQSEDLRPWANNFDFSNNTEDYGYLSQTIETAGKRSRRLQLANANMQQTEADRTLQMQQIAGRAAASYWNTVSTAQISKLLQQDLSAVDDMVRYHQERVAAGAMRGADLLRMQIERDRLFIALEAARREAVLARVDLGRQIGRPLNEDVVLSDSIDAPDPVPYEDLATVLAERPDVTLAEDGVTAAEADLKLQKSLGVPDLDLLGGYKRNSGANTLYGGLQIPLPFGNRNQGQVQRTQASIRLAQNQLEEAKLMAQTDVAAATEAYTREQEIVEKTLPDMRARAKQNLAIMSDAYRTEGVDLLRYIDAERTEMDVEVNALRTLAEYHQSALRLKLAYGVQP
ncbi:MAG: outer membrane protein heavy metal efflux system [Acidobacteriaceae bacterium]|jgi:cobalt-zinc-cadmium efflux system outer membrane protein|nr:outer membrane protein heavy metal efflux system [Acidobacteriaceae bacterium]